jgi:hydrogenase-4 component F
MIPLLVLIPALGGAAAFFVRDNKSRRALLLAAAGAHALAVAATWIHPPAPLFAGWLVLDAPGRLFLSIASAVFLAAAVYASAYLPRMRHEQNGAAREESLLRREPEAVFVCCLLLFLASMSLICVSGHFGLLWVAVEASTLASAPLIYYHRHSRSLEATWKYLVVCSVGVALALLGNFFLAVASASAGAPPSVLLADLLAAGPRLESQWLKAAFLFFLVGYGTKMGLAPLHNWLPDAHSESPSLVSALLSGALLNCAFLGILRALQVCAAAGIDSFARPLLVGFGLVSAAVAAVFILRQADYKRMLAYSSVEHMGILALGVGLGGGAVFGAMLHAVNHSLTKAMLFLVAGNILTAYHTKSTRDVRGVMRALPVSGALWVAGFLAITGTPPFGPFLSEFTIFRAALDQGQVAVAVTYLALLGVIFVGMAGVVLRMSQGAPSSTAPLREPWAAIAPPAVLAAAVLLLGLYIPAPLRSVLQEAARVLGG